MKKKMLGLVLVVVAVLCVSNIQATSDLIVYYPFNYTAAGHPESNFYQDASGNGHTLETATNAVGNDMGRPGVNNGPSGYGYCAGFTGGSGAVTINPIDLSAYNHVRVSFWLKDTTTPSYRRLVFETGTYAPGVTSGISMYIDGPTNTVKASLTSFGGQLADTFASVAGVWRFYELEYDLTATADEDVVKVFVDGVLTGSMTVNTGTLATGMFNEKLYFGPYRAPFVGYLDEFKIEGLVPVPATLILLAAGAVLSLRRKRKILKGLQL